VDCPRLNHTAAAFATEAEFLDSNSSIFISIIHLMRFLISAASSNIVKKIYRRQRADDH
jgi:hypothetical protein